MIPRLLVYHAFPALVWWLGLEFCSMLKIRAKNESRFDTPLRMVLSVLLLLPGSLPLIAHLMLGKFLLIGSVERAFSIALAIALLALTIGLLWRGLRAPRLSHEEFKEWQKRHRWRTLGVPLGGVLLIIAIGAGAWFWGRHTGMRALNDAAAESETVIAQRPKGVSTEAAKAYRELFSDLSEDKGLSRSGCGHYDHGHKPWPKDKALTEFMEAQRKKLERIRSLADGAPPAFDERLYEPLWNDSRPLTELRAGFRRIGTLIQFAEREAAERGDFKAVLSLYQLGRKLAEHAEVLPVPYCWPAASSVSTPNYATLGLVVSGARKSNKTELAALARDFAKRRQEVPKACAKREMEWLADNVIRTRELADPRNKRPPDESVLEHLMVPLYGKEFFTDLLPRTRDRYDIAALPFSQAREELRSLQNEIVKERQLKQAFRFLFICARDPDYVLARAANLQMFWGAYETACALQLYALDNGEYPKKLGDLTPKHLESSLLDPKGPVRLNYERTEDGCRLGWTRWQAEDGKIRLGSRGSEIILKTRAK